MPLHHYAITSLCHCIIMTLHIMPLHHYAIASLCHCIIIPFHHYAIASLCHCIIMPLHHYAIASLYHCIIMPLHHYAKVSFYLQSILLHVNVTLCYSGIWSLRHFNIDKILSSLRVNFQKSISPTNLHSSQRCQHRVNGEKRLLCFSDICVETFLCLF
jgi:hypothetical protein